MHFSIEIWAAMAVFAFITSVTPGPNNLMLLASGVNHGVRASLRHLAGISAGHSFMLVSVGAGLGQVFVRFPAIYSAMKVVGVLYMLYLAWAVAHSGAPLSAQSNAHLTGPLGFWAAAVFQWVNPKAWMMALGYHSNFLPQDASLGMVVLAALFFSAVNLPAISLWLVAGARLRRYFEVDRYRNFFNWTMACLLVLATLPVLVL